MEYDYEMNLRFQSWTAWLPITFFGLLVLACSPVPTPTPRPAPPQEISTAAVGASAAPAEAAPQPTQTPPSPDLPTQTPSPQPAITEIPTKANPTAVPFSAENPAVTRLSDLTWTFLKQLTEELSPRESATDEEKVAADYLLGELEAIGYQARLQPFTFERLSAGQGVLLPDGETIRSSHLRFSGVGAVTGVLADVALAHPEEVSADLVSGKVALIRRGLITFEEKTARVTQAGAIAAIIYNNEPGLLSGTLQTQAGIPVVSISRADGERLLSLVTTSSTDDEITVTISVETTAYPSRNVIADRSAVPGNGKVLVIGAHYDTTPGTQGANDNGTGVSTLMTLSAELADAQLPFDLRFILFGSEEVGLLGSRHYVEGLSQSEIESIIAMINIDSTGSGITLEAIGDSDLADRALAFADSNGIPIRRGALSRRGSSDHAPFRDAGAPVLMLIASDLSRINSPRDDIEFVRPEFMGAAAAIAIDLIDRLASEH